MAVNTSSPSTVAVTSRTSPAPGRSSKPRRSTENFTSCPGRTGLSIVAVNSITRLPMPASDVATAACSAIADSHIPWTITPGRPASAAARESTWIGLRSPVTQLNGSIALGASTVNAPRKLRGVSVTVGNGTVLVRAVSPPFRPRMAKHSLKVASSVSPSRTSARTTTSRPKSVSTISSTRALIRNVVVFCGRAPIIRM